MSVALSPNDTKKEKTNGLASVVVVLRDDAGQLETFLREVHGALDDHFTDFEIVVVEYNSRDKSTRIVEELLSKLTRIRLLKLSGVTNDEVALAAGVENAIGDFVVCMSVATDSADLVVAGIEKCVDGADVVTGVSDRRPGFLHGLLSQAYRIVFQKMVDYRIPKNATTFRVLSRSAVNAVTATSKYRHRFLVSISQLDHRHDVLLYSPRKSGSSSGSGLIDRISTSAGTVVFNSATPLRCMSLVGLGGSTLAVLYALFSLLVYVWKQRVVEGWTTLMLVISSLFFLQFLMLAFLSEYISRLIDDASGHREYSVVYEKHSSVMLDGLRYNVLVDEGSSAQDIAATVRSKPK